MSYDLRGAGGEFRFNVGNWSMVLELAKQFGWEPRGTLPPQSKRLRDNLPANQREAYNAWIEDIMSRSLDDPRPWPPEPLSDDAWVEEPPDLDWGGGYESNYHQRVTDEDAASLAAAFERALPELRDYNVTENKLRPIRALEQHPFKALPDVMDIQYFGPAPDADPIEWFSGDNKQKIVEFIAFCKAGGFTIA